MHTKLANPHYPPEIQAEATLINFKVTEDGLRDQLLNLVVSKERPDLASKNIKLIKQQIEFKITHPQETPRRAIFQADKRSGRSSFRYRTYQKS
jgi:hypothetical protein